MSLCSQVIILIGNKADLEAQRDVTYEEAKQFAEENGESEPEPRRGQKRLVLMVVFERFGVFLEADVCFVPQVCCFSKPVRKRKCVTACRTPGLSDAPELTVSPLAFRGENVEDAFLEAAKKIYQNIQDGSLDLNAAESGVQHKPSAPQGGRLTSEPQPQREGCGC